MKTLVEYIIRLRNPHFSFASDVDGQMLFSLIASKLLAFGRGLRMLFYLKVPKMLFLGKGVKLFCSHKISLGSWVNIADAVYLSGLGRGGLKIGDYSSIGAFSRLVVSTSFNNLGSHIHIGSNVGIGEFAYLGGGGGLEIGDECIIGQYFSCHPENHLYGDPSCSIRLQGVSRQGIRIGRNCWIGSKVTVLDGVSIGNNCVVAAGSVVTKPFPDNCLLAGVPAKIIKKIASENQIANPLIAQSL